MKEIKRSLNLQRLQIKSQVCNLSPACPIGVLLLSLAVFANTIEASPQPKQVSEMRSKVLIVGAGVSGIGAASKLLQKGLTDVTILEAMDRIGGRVYYKELGGDYGGVDLGGHWVHGQEGNIVYELAHPLGLVNHSGDFSNALFFRPDGTQLEFEQKKLHNMFLEIFSKTQLGQEELKGKNYEDIVDDIVKQFTGEYGFSEEDAKAVLNHIKQTLCALEACAHVSDVSVKTAAEFQESEGDRLIEWKKGGMSNIIHILTGTHEKSPWKGLGVESKVKLNSRISKIDWSNEDGVSVTTESGSTLSADFVIFTPSLRVLKKKHQDIFDPPLPNEKVEAIKNLGMDVVDKVYLVYQDPWWPKNVTDFNLLHSKEYKSDTQDLGDAIVSVSAENHNPHVLGVWFTGDGARRMEATSEQALLQTIMETLNKYLGKRFTITEPDMIVRSQWGSNEDVGGSYSYNSVASDHLDNPRGTLEEPLTNKDGKPVVLFAGEATSRTHYSTVHGALETGWREAGRILEYLENN